MGYFPLCVDLTGKEVYLIGNGEQIRDKAEKMKPFGAHLIRKDTFTEADAQQNPALVIVGDTEYAAAEKIALLCSKYRIPVNVVDVPQLCGFTFPALIARGDLTVSISTSGKCPGAAVYFKKRLQAQIPDHADEILGWLAQVRLQLKARYPAEQFRTALRLVTAQAFEADRPLTDGEMEHLLSQV